jgi:hypothetical protein
MTAKLKLVRGERRGDEGSCETCLCGAAQYSKLHSKLREI